MPMHDRIIPYLERVGLYHLARLNSHWFWLDEPLVSAIVERWRPETHTFHMPFGECTVTLQDVAFQLGLPVDGEAVSGCLGEFDTYIEGGRPAWEWFQDLFGELPPPNKVKQMTVHFTWFHERFSVLPPDANEETLFGDKSANRVHIRWLPFVANLDEMGRYSWGSAALAWLYRCMCRVANRNVTNLAGPLQLLQSWIFWRFPSLRPSGFDYFSFPLASKYGLCFFHRLKNLCCVPEPEPPWAAPIGISSSLSPPISSGSSSESLSQSAFSTRSGPTSNSTSARSGSIGRTTAATTGSDIDAPPRVVD
ncbi:hypothetical protein Ahy_A05g024999 isoform B [Arachis hypogaea]|uniref:Aminotransferase-like plant mobile domain-containing protein n=1 Tax=Arachis hypogaea TaxID=3818 RepID=A0A445D7E8_ARAHY|nr:hypothetical protein Ahy_A05g024999 isoform B [Arachis hypogaea]